MELSKDQQRLLHLIYLFTGKHGIRERWIKELPLHVTIYFAIEKGAFDHYDFSPSLITSHGTRIFANRSQEAMHDIQVMREMDLVEKMKLRTETYEDIAAYCITELGAETHSGFNNGIKQDIDQVLACNECGKITQMKVNRTAKGGAIKMTANRKCLGCCAKCDNDCHVCGVDEIVDFFKVVHIQYKTLPYLPEATR